MIFPQLSVWLYHPIIRFNKGNIGLWNNDKKAWEDDITVLGNKPSNRCVREESENINLDDKTLSVLPMINESYIIDVTFWK